LYDLERQVMLKLVARAPSVLVGRGGFCALRQRAATLHVSIHADLEFRIKYLVARGKAANPEAARQAIAAADRDRAAFIRAISGLDWHDPRNFDLVLDASRLGLESCLELVVAEAKQRFG
jgi:cytidylate kinase